MTKVNSKEHLKNLMEESISVPQNPLLPTSLTSPMDDADQIVPGIDEKVAPCFVKFYRYEEIKKKYKRQNPKDILRQRLFERMQDQKQLQTEKLNL